MTFLEFLASQLDKEVTQYDNQRIIGEDVNFWNLCLECRRLLLDERLAKEEVKDVPDNKHSIKMDSTI